MKKTSLSVLVPAYNEEYFVEESLKRLFVLEESPYLEKIDETNIMPIPGGGQRVRVTIKGALRVFDNNLLEWCEIDGT